MKHNGFTLIELLISIGLIALVSTIIIFNMTGLQSNQNETEYKRFKTIITSAACSYIDNQENTSLRDDCKKKSSCNISLDTLIANGEIDENLVNPSTKNKVSSEKNKIYVKIEWIKIGNGVEKQCSFQTEDISNTN